MWILLHLHGLYTFTSAALGAAVTAAAATAITSICFPLALHHNGHSSEAGVNSAMSMR